MRKEHVYDPAAAAAASEQRLREREAASQAALAAEQAEAGAQAEAHDRRRHAVEARGFAASALADARPLSEPGDVEPEQGAQPDSRPQL